MGALRAMKLPDDERIIVSVHAYSPYNYAMNSGYSKKFSDSDKKELDKFFSDLNSLFISKGIQVVIIISRAQPSMVFPAYGGITTAVILRAASALEFTTEKQENGHSRIWLIR